MALAALPLLFSRGSASSGNVGQNTAEFLRLGAGARALGMGEAYGAVAEGAEGIYWNPAGLGGQPVKEFHYSRSEFMGYFHHDFAAYAQPLGHGALGIALTRLSQDDLPVVTNANVTIGEFSPHSEAITIAYGRRFAEDDPNAKDRDYFRDSWAVPGNYRPLGHERDLFEGAFKAGLALKLINETIYSHNSAAFAVDGGVIYHPVGTDGLGVSGAFRNVGSQQKFIAESESLPAEFDLGVSYSSRWDRSRLLPVIEAVLPYYGMPNGKMGIEYSFPAGEDTTMALRIGYKSLTVAEAGAVSGLTGGVGASFWRLTCDFAFQPLGLLGESYRMSLSMRW